MNRYLCKSGGKTVIVTGIIQNMSPERQRINQSLKDQFQEKSYDVFCKGVIETEVIGDKKIMYLKDILEKFVTIAKVIKNVDVSKCRAFKLKQRLMKSYPQLVFCVPKMRKFSEIVYVENLDSSELVVLLKCEISLKTKMKKTTIDDYNLNSDTETEKNSEVNELQFLYNAAMILREKVHEIPKINLPWPPLASDLTMDNVQKVVPCELYNMLAWTCGFFSKSTLSKYIPIEGKNNTKLTSIEI